MKQLNRFKYILPSLITALLLLIIYGIKHIYPFGNITIDYYDMAQQIASFYYHVFDFLHGEKNLFYDQYTAMSVNMAMSTSGCSSISIFNLFFLFVKREMLLESLSYFLMLKMMLMSLTMYFYIHKRHNVSYIYEVAFSVAYAFSGYVLMLYMTIQWLDIAIVFPILMYFLHDLIEEGKIKGYIIILSMSIIMSYYLSFMILIYIVLMVGVKIVHDRLAKEDANYHLLKLLIATVISMLISMFILLPQMCQTLISARFNNENEGGLISMYYGIVSTTKPAYTTRFFTLFLSSLAFAVIVYGIFKFRKEKVTVISALLALFVILSELVVEGVNLFWHFGSYVQYPIRNGFLINFTLAVVALRFLEKFEYKNDSKKSKDTYIFMACISFVGIALLATFISKYGKMQGLTTRDVFHMTALAMGITFVIYLVALTLKSGRFFNGSLILIALECVLFGYVLIGKPAFTTGYTEDPEQEGEYIRICNQLDEALHLNAVDYMTDSEEIGLFSRVKNPDTSLNANYGLTLRRPVLSNWTHLLSPKLQRDAATLGYSVQYTRLLDAGGTVFSDALIGVDEVLTCVNQDDSLYTLKNSVDVTSDHLTLEKRTYYLYDCNYKLPFGLVVDNVDYGFSDNADICDVYNNIYGSISGTDEKIAKCEFDERNCAEHNLSKDIDVAGKKALYYLADQVDTDDYNTTIKVNGDAILVPSIAEIDNTLYPAHFNNNAVYLGTFENETVAIDVAFSDEDKAGNEVESSFSPKVISIDLSLLEKIADGSSEHVTERGVGKSEYVFRVTADSSNKYLLLPLSYDEGYKVTVNGNKQEVVPVGGMFSAVLLPEGESLVRIHFVPKGMIAGIIVTILACLALMAILYFDNTKDFLQRDYKWLTNLYVIGFAIIIIFMYIVPYGFYILDLFI